MGPDQASPHFEDIAAHDPILAYGPRQHGRSWVFYNDATQPNAHGAGGFSGFITPPGEYTVDETHRRKLQRSIS